MSIQSLWRTPGPTGFGYSSTAEQVTEGLDLSGKTYLVTGCNSGLGEETVRVLNLRGASVIGLARTLAKAKGALDGLEDGVPVACELSEPDSVRAAVETVQATGRTLDGIIANAGIMALPELETVHGFERQFFTNHVGHFILVTGLLEQLADDGRVVMLSSNGHEMAPEAGIEFDNLDGSKRYSGWRNYGQSKLANLLFARELARRFEGTDKTANAVHPGVIATNLGRHMNSLLVGLSKVFSPLVMKSVEQGAATQVYVATHPDAASVNGEYWQDCNVHESSKNGQDLDLAKRLWEHTEGIIESLPTTSAAA